MTLTDMNKWTSGETEAFFDPRQTPSAAGGNNNPGNRKLLAQPSVAKIGYLATAATIGAFVSLALVVVLMRAPVEPTPAASETVQLIGSGTLVTGGRALGDVEGTTKPITASPTAINSTLPIPILNLPTTTVADPRLATSRAERKPAPPHQTLKGERTRLSVNDEAERKETTRLMVDELSQRGIVAGTAAGSGHPE